MDLKSINCKRKDQGQPLTFLFLIYLTKPTKRLTRQGLTLKTYSVLKMNRLA